MAKTVAIGIQDFGDLMHKNCFYIDKTHFIREWWESADSVTLITRPRRFGKTLTMSMLEHFFSVRYANQGKIFEGLSIWKHEEYRKLQGTYPVINLSFANVKGGNYETVRKNICQVLMDLYSSYAFLLKELVLTEKDKAYFNEVSSEMDDSTAIFSLHRLCKYLYQYYGKKVILFLDEYDTPMQEAYVNGYWDEMAEFIRGLFNSAFKTNPCMERAILTGITRISKESVFSDLNNLKVVTTTSEEYADVFGFTETEVFAAMEEVGFTNKEEVKRWYDGFIFGKVKGIYNPWSIINFLDTGKLAPYWANTSANTLAGKLIQEGDHRVKTIFEELLRGNSVVSAIDEEIVYNQLERNSAAVWSLLLASGYLKALRAGDDGYELALTNYEVETMFHRMVREWFQRDDANYNDFLQALLLGDIDAMNEYMNRISRSIFSYFDTGKEESASEPERFYHGFVLGLIVELEGRYVIQSNRESGFGRYDVILEPLRRDDHGIIIEFKVYYPGKEKNLEETVKNALNQIEEKNYEQVLRDHGIAEENICKYGFAFAGKRVLIGKGGRLER